MSASFPWALISVMVRGGVFGEELGGELCGCASGGGFDDVITEW